MKKFSEDEKYHKLVILLSESNTPPYNLIYGDFVSDEISSLYREVRDNIGSSLWTALLSELQKDVVIDKDKISKYYLGDIAVEYKKGYSKEKYPELSDIEKLGLIKIDFPTTINKNGFRYKDNYLVFPHLFSRNFHFTNWMIDNWKGDFELSLPYDPDYLGVVGSERKMILLSHWMGPKTTTKVAESLGGKERIIFGSYENIDGSFYDITEFYFVCRKGIWHLEIEELLPMPSIIYQRDVNYRGIDIKYHTLYLHALTNSSLTKCSHIDGAIRGYGSEQNFRKRHNMNINRKSPKDLSTRHKLFRMDSESGIENFQEIIGLFFESNPYIMEFFEGENDITRDLQKKREYVLKNEIPKILYL
jgi:hypothetical protein